MIARVAGIIASETELDPLLQRASDAIHELLGFAIVDIPLIDRSDSHTLVIRIRGGEYEQYGLATAAARLLSFMVPGPLALHLDFAGYVPQARRHEWALLRVCQEAVPNVIRHAEASRVEVAVRVDGECVQQHEAHAAVRESGGEPAAQAGGCSGHDSPPVLIMDHDTS